MKPVFLVEFMRKLLTDSQVGPHLILEFRNFKGSVENRYIW